METSVDPLRQRPFRRVGAALPKPVLDHFSAKLRHAGIRADVRVWLGGQALLAFFVGALCLCVYLVLFNPAADAGTIAVSASLFFGGGLLVLVLSYLRLYYIISDRTSTVEKVLPDFLLLTVSNLRAGMSPFAAFVKSALPEFGPFYEEVKLSTAEAGGKSSLSDALNAISSHFDSHILQRTVSLFSKGLRSGGHLARLLNSIAQEVRRIQDLRAELASSTRSYTLFLAFILIFVMPFLLSVSTHFVHVFLQINAQNAGNSGASAIPNMPSFSGAILISEGDMVTISLVMIATTSFFMAILMGILTKGRATYGLKYFPLLAIAATFAYFVSKIFIGTFLAGFAS